MSAGTMLNPLSPVRRWMVRTALLVLFWGIAAAASVMLGHGIAFSLFGICVLLLVVAADWIAIVGGARRSSPQDDEDRSDRPAV
ncbi:hypothetical protein [Micromonospora sp. NPDC049497]|uniref:hypothetical protein n=1 Tax=Micromonospora sp. NPDC049497 TaxID=3364273 RepID=UPI0037BB0D8B